MTGITFAPGRVEAQFAATSSAELRRWIDALSALLPLLDGASTPAPAAVERSPAAAPPPLPAARRLSVPAGPPVAAQNSGPRARIRPWTAADDARLRGLAGRPWAEVGRELGRTNGACGLRARKLGLTGPGRGKRDGRKTVAPPAPEIPAAESPPKTEPPARSPPPKSPREVEQERIEAFVAAGGVSKLPPAYVEEVRGGAALNPLPPLVKGENGLWRRGDAT